MMARRGWAPQRGGAKRGRSSAICSFQAWAAVGLMLFTASSTFMLHTYMNFGSSRSPSDHKKRQHLPPPPGQSEFRRSLLHKIDRDLAPYGRITRAELLASAAELSPWTMTVQFRSDRTVWIAPPAMGVPWFETALEVESQTKYIAATLASLALMMQYADSVPSTTAVFHQADNCLYTRADSPTLRAPARSLKNHTWAHWVSSGTKIAPPLEGSGEEIMSRHGPAAHRGPVLMYQDAQWRGSSLTCFGLAFPSYDWVWATEDFTDGSEDRVDGLQEVPWAERLPKLVFRGTGWLTDSVVYNGNQGERALRLRVAKLALDYEDIMDVKLIKCSGEPCDPRVLGRRMTWYEQFEYKYQLDVDGHGGCYRTKHLLISGSLVFKIDSPISQFWVTELQPWVHYIPVSWHDLESDLPLKLRWAMQHDKEAERIMLNGRRWVLENLNNQNVAWYQSQVLAQLAMRQAEEFSLIPGAVRFCCNHLESGGRSSEANISHYVQTCKQFAPDSMRYCNPNHNAFNLALYGSAKPQPIPAPLAAGRAAVTEAEDLSQQQQRLQLARLKKGLATLHSADTGSQM